MTALLCLPLDELLGFALAEAEGDVGDAAPALLVKAYAHAASRESDGYIPTATLLHLTHHRQPRKVVAVLVEAGCLRQQGKGYVLARYLDANPSRAQRDRQRASEASRKAKQRKDDWNTTPDTHPESTPESRQDSTPESHPESRRDMQPPSLHSPLSGSEIQQGETPGSDAGKPAPPGMSHRDSGVDTARDNPRDSQGDSTRDTGRDKPAPKAKSTRPYRAELAAAYAAGVSQATGKPCSQTTKSWDLEALDAATLAHGAGQVGAELLGWVTSSAAAYVTACRDSGPDQGKGFSPERWKAWLDAGSPAVPASRPASRPQTPVQPPPEGQEPGYWAKRAKRLTPQGIVDPTAATPEEVRK